MKSALGHSAGRGFTYSMYLSFAVGSEISSPVTGERSVAWDPADPSLADALMLSYASTASRHSIVPVSSRSVGRRAAAMRLTPELVIPNPQRQLGNLARPRLDLDAMELPRMHFFE